MPAVPAQIQLTWTSNFAGPHRVCYRIGGVGPYICTVDAPGTPTHPNCPGGGSPCAYNLDITVDDELCGTVDYDGYVQPTCEDEGSLLNRTPFAVAFEPNPACKGWDIHCESNGVAAINVIGGGSGYGAPPTVTIAGDGLGATATAVLGGAGGDEVVSITVDTPGSGYTVPPTVVIAAPGGPGDTATAVATLLDCDPIDARNCLDNIGPEQHAPIPVGDTVRICWPVEPAGLPAEYEITENSNCLCDCRTVDVQNTGGESVDITYFDCAAQDKATLNLTQASGIVALCIATNSLTYVENGSAVFNIVDTGACDGDGV